MRVGRGESSTLRAIGRFVYNCPQFKGAHAYALVRTIPPMFFIDASWCLCSSYVPVPDSGTCCGLPPPSSLMETAALLAPVADGWKVTLIVQLAPTPSVPPQV